MARDYFKQIEKDSGLLLEMEGQPAKWIPLPQGRPRKTDVTEPSKPRSVRLPDSVWDEPQARAKKRGVGVQHAAARARGGVSQEGGLAMRANIGVDAHAFIRGSIGADLRAAREHAGLTQATVPAKLSVCAGRHWAASWV